MWGRKKFKIGELVEKLALNALFSNFPLIFFGTYLVEKYVINGLPTIYRDYLATLALAAIQFEIVTDSNLVFPFRNLTKADVELDEAISCSS